MSVPDRLSRPEDLLQLAGGVGQLDVGTRPELTWLGGAGDTFRDSIGADDYSGFFSSKTMQGRWVVRDSILESQRITLELECSAKGPGGILLASDSECDAAVSLVGEFDVTVTEILQP